MPLTVDLKSGEPLDWGRAFKPAFFKAGSVGGAHALYARSYRLAQRDRGCVPAIDEADFILWFDRRRGGLLMQPDLAHAMKACADVIVLPFRTLKPLIRDPDLARDLAAADVGIHALP